MREIKFRYWNDVTSVMVNNPEMPHKKGWTVEQLFSERGWIWMQFTGLKDKDGREIYEGDIVKETYLGTDEETIYAIHELPRFFHLHKENVLTPQNGEIIGNVFEHPDLLSPNNQS